MPDTRLLLAEAQRRAKESWEADGLQTIVLSFPLTLFGVLVCLMAFRIIHDGVLWTCVFLLVYLFLILVSAGHREIVQWLKSKITYPRTGYVGVDDSVSPPDGTVESDWTVESDPLSGRRFTSLSIYAPVAAPATQDETEVVVPRSVVVAAHLRSAAAGISRILCVLLPLINLWGHAAFRIAAPWILASGLILGSIGWKPSTTGKIAWAERFVFAAAGIAVVAWSAARAHWLEIFAVIILGGGFFLLLRGTIALLRYVRRNPVVQA